VHHPTAAKCKAAVTPVNLEAKLELPKIKNFPFPKAILGVQRILLDFGNIVIQYAMVISPLLALISTYRWGYLQYFFTHPPDHRRASI
jgi:hypothetical protein